MKEHEHEYEYSQGLAKRSSGPDMLNLQRLSDQYIYIYIYIKERNRSQKPESMFVLIKTESVADRSKRIRDDVFSKVLVFVGGKFLCV